MPNWQPNWEDVRWDWAAAERAAQRLEQAAGELDSTSATRRGAADWAAREWRGNYRVRFDQQMLEAARGAWSLAGDFREAAARIRRASQQARDEQTHREQERERWRREKADEDRRAREARDRHDREARAQAAQAAQAAQSGP